MRLLLSAYACDPTKGGESGTGWNLAARLAESGHHVWLLTARENREAVESGVAAMGMRLGGRLNAVYVPFPEMFRKIFRRHGFTGVVPRYLLWQRYALRAARELDATHDFDLVHHVTWGSLQGASRLYRLGKPFVLGPVGGGQTAPLAFRDYFESGWREEALRTFLTKRIVAHPWNPFTRDPVRGADLVLAANRETLDLAERLGARRVEVTLDSSLPEHYLADAPQSIRPNGRPLDLIWTGRIYPRKGLALTLEALSHVSARTPFHLTIYGDGPMAHRVPAWIERYGLQGRVTHAGHVPWEALHTAYREADAFVFTSLRDSMPAQLLEAMASGLPILTLDHHGARDHMPPDAGIKVPVTAPAEVTRAIARAVEYLYDHPDLRAEMSRAGWTFARSKRWPDYVASIERHYEVVLAQSGSTSRPRRSP